MKIYLFAPIFIFAAFFGSGQEVTLLNESFGSPILEGEIISVEKHFPGSQVDGYHIYLPSSLHSSEQAYPLIVYLQGARGIGGDLNIALEYGLPQMLLSDLGDNEELNTLVKEKFIYLIPHLAEGEYVENSNAIHAIIDEISGTYNLDKNKIYLTGVSKGASGVWGLASINPDLFAAIAPICGMSYSITNYDPLNTIPVWAAHNLGDETVSIRECQDILEKIENSSDRILFQSSSPESADISRDFLFTSFRKNGHDAWTDMYNSVPFYTWLLQQSKIGQR